MVSRRRTSVCVDKCAEWDNVGLVSIPAQADGRPVVTRQPGHLRRNYACDVCWQSGMERLKRWPITYLCILRRSLSDISTVWIEEVRLWESLLEI
jgi:hypothetical protein